MDNTRTAVVVAIIGLVGVLATAVLSNWDKLFGSSGNGGGAETARYSTTCKFTTGQRAGTQQYYPPGTPGLKPVIVGGPCTDGLNSWGYAVRD